MLSAADGLVEFSNHGASMAAAVSVTFHEVVWMPKPGVDIDFACTFDAEPGSRAWNELFDLISEETSPGPVLEATVTWTKDRGRGEKPPVVNVVGDAEFAIDLDRDGTTESQGTADVADYDMGTLRDTMLLPYGG
jgi:hypothetical protein